ncbi:unnamed protein product, partial [marine sediment metagenome]
MKAKNPSNEELIESLKLSLLDDEGKIKISELKALQGGNELEIKVLRSFLKTEDFSFYFTTLDEFFAYLFLLLDFLTLQEFYDVLHCFKEKKLKTEIKENLFDIDIETFKSYPSSFDAEEVESTVIDIEWSESGANYTPVAIIEPVLIAGSTV